MSISLHRKCKYLTASEAARRVGVCAPTMQRWIRTQRLEPDAELIAGVKTTSLFAEDRLEKIRSMANRNLEPIL